MSKYVCWDSKGQSSLCKSTAKFIQANISRPCLTQFQAAGYYRKYSAISRLYSSRKTFE